MSAWSEFRERCAANVQRIRDTNDDGMYAKLYADDVTSLLMMVGSLDRQRDIDTTEAGAYLGQGAMKQEVIDGWECWVRETGVRVARQSQLKLGEVPAVVSWSFERGLGGANAWVPTTVLGWLIKPLLRTAYAEGWSDRNGQLDGSAMPEVYKDQSADTGERLRPKGGDVDTKPRCACCGCQRRNEANTWFVCDCKWLNPGDACEKHR